MTTKAERLCAEIASLEQRRASDLAAIRKLRSDLNKTLKGGAVVVGQEQLPFADNKTETN